VFRAQVEYWLSLAWAATKISELLLLGKQRSANEMIMKKKAKNQKISDDLRPEYDFSALKNGVRGKYAARFSAGTNLVLLSPDVAKYFPDEQSVNAALRSLIHATKQSRRGTH
jgi:hypothetical protein